MAHINLNNYAKAAKEILSDMAYGYYADGVADNLTMSENEAAFQRIKLFPKMLVDVSQRDLHATVLGQTIDFPAIVAPTAMAGLAHVDKELGIARATANAGTIMCVSTLSTTSLEELGRTGANLWFQLYVLKDKSVNHSLIKRAEDAGFSALVITVDAPVPGYREALIRQPIILPETLKPENLAEYWDSSRHANISEYFATQLDTAITWADLEDITTNTKLPILLKGVLRPDDAERAVASGVAGIIVSNHGGRQLDTAVSGIEALPYVVEAVDEAIDILVDGGVRRGTDILKALALGAKAVMVGRPILWGLAVEGQAGVEHIFAILRQEYDIALANAGIKSSKTISKDIIFNK